MKSFIRFLSNTKNVIRIRQHQNNYAAMWSIINPPDIIEETPPFIDIEKAFNISIDEDDCLELYDMKLDEAADKILNILQNQC